MLHNVNLVKRYFEAVAQGDFEIIEALFSRNIIWHQPGQGIQSGTFRGKAAIFKHLGNLMQWSGGTFTISSLDYCAANQDLVVPSIYFKAEKAGKQMGMKGVDLIRVEVGKIVEVWLFSELIEEEDAFWNCAATA
jgi:ketosteroid isomerase-like protein